ncbi:uncharacterized protein LOC129605240 isoform X5 [Condylostylus longicornis]|uniref:uncharacterized protein LOC129605240 isoform X5 n=1 Tax=Condylostylus longicornis TaxID=2530218 RepID=UPI00244DB3B9|nr:uncharacterized protein LOC129605240 isoform X5 [Condylostylus longicornis]
MWSPTHVQVTVQRAKGLLTKGKNGTNNCFVTIALGKDKYQTSIREKASQNVEWHEECELAIPEKGNTAELILTCLHHNSLGIDEFLGQVTLPLRDMDAYDTPRPKWFKLQSKPGQEKKDKERGELEVRINFTVKAGSLSDLSKKEKHKSSFNQLASSVGGSLLSIGTLEKKKGIKKIATSIGSKLHLTGKKKDKKGGGGDVDSESFTGSMASIGTPNSSLGGSRKWNGRSYIGNTDPGVADDGDINFDRLSQRSSISNISYAQEHNINNSPTINRPSVTISSQNNFSNGVPENKNVPQNGDKSMGNQNNSNSNINVNQMDSDSTPSLKRRIWGKTRVPLPIPERSEDELLKNGSQKYDIRNSHFENEDHDVVLRAKDEPILQESRNSQMLDVPETHKPKPRQFLPSNTDDDFALDNLSCNSSPFSSLTSQSYYDYNPNNDSVRLSNKVEEDDEDSGFGTFSRGDSKRRASRKKYFAPVLKEREIEKRFEESMHNVEKEIIIDFEPQNNSKFEENKNEIEINSDTEISANPMYYSDNFFKKPDPPARRVKNSQIHNSPNFVKIEHENISAEYQFAEKYEKVNPESIAISTNKAKIIETRNEEVVKFNTGVAEITQVAPPLKVELEDIDNIATYERQPDTVIEKYPYFVSHKNEVSNLTIQLEKPFEEENVEILGSKNESVPDLNESNCNKNCEVHENQYKSFPLCEESTNKVSVSNIRSRFEQNSPRNNSILISSKDNSKLELECSQENSYNRKSSEININLTLITPANEEKVFEKMKMEHYATKTMPIERFEKAPLQSKAVEYSIARELGIVKEEAFAVECCTKEVVENFTSQNLAVKSNVVQILEVKKEQNVAVECAIAEVFENAHVNNIANEIYVKEQIETRNEEDFAIECNIAQAFENAVIKSMAKETYVKQEFENRKEENLAVELNMVEVFENTMMIENKEEDYSDSKFEKSFKIPNSSSTITSEDEDDYESQYSEPELKTNKLNITKNVGNDSQTKTDSKVFQSIDFESNEANTKIPIARPRNPNAEVFNNLAESSSSNCSSLENMYLTVVVPKRVGNQDPGVIEDDDEFVFDKLSHKSSGSSLNISRGHNDYNHRIPSPVISKEEDRNSSKIPSPPAKPPRNASDQKLDEWESKLYGNHLEIGSTDSLKRRSWGNNRIPLNTAEENEEPYEDVKLSPSSNTSSNGITKNETTMNDINISPKTGVKSQQRNDVILETPEMNQSKENIEKISEEKPVSPKIAVTNAEVTEKKESKLEKLLNKSPLLRTQSREALDNSDLNINKRSSTNNAKVRPRALPRSDTISIFTDDVIQSPEDAKEIREKLKKDQKEISEKTEKIEKKHRFGKFKYFAKRGESKNDLIEENGFHGERHNPIGHENFSENENSLPELSPELLNKYDGKSREDIILIADSFEKEMVMERNRVKELEEYLDNLLLRVMETHPKILQNPYRTTSTKSFQRFSSFSG